MTVEDISYHLLPPSLVASILCPKIFFLKDLSAIKKENPGLVAGVFLFLDLCYPA